MKLSTVTAICLVFVVVACAQSSEQTAPLSFSRDLDMGELGTPYGATLGFTFYTASDGASLTVLSLTRTDAAEASRVFEQELSRAKKVLSTTEFRDGNGEVGRRAVLIVKSKRLTYAVMWTSRGDFHQILGGAMRHITELEKWYNK